VLVGRIAGEVLEVAEARAADADREDLGPSDFRRAAVGVDVAVAEDDHHAVVVGAVLEFSLSGVHAGLSVGASARAEPVDRGLDVVQVISQLLRRAGSVVESRDADLVVGIRIEDSFRKLFRAAFRVGDTAATHRSGRVDHELNAHRIPCFLGVGVQDIVAVLVVPYRHVDGVGQLALTA